MLSVHCKGNYCVIALSDLGCYCHGDPHCYSFDSRESDYQGKCKYTLARDGCTQGYPSKEIPSFEVTGDFKRWKDTEFSMIETVTVRFYGERNLVSH